MFAWSVKPFSSACYCDFQGLFHSRLSACVRAQSLSVVQSLSKVMLIYLLSSFFHAFMTFLACILLDLCIGSHDNSEFLEFKSCNFFLHVLFEILIFKHNNWTKIFSCERLNSWSEYTNYTSLWLWNHHQIVWAVYHWWGTLTFGKFWIIGIICCII